MIAMIQSADAKRTHDLSGPPAAFVRQSGGPASPSARHHECDKSPDVAEAVVQEIEAVGFP